MPNCSRCDCCHASIAGTRYFVRGEHVRAVGGEAAVTTHAARDERLGDGVGREQLLLGPGQLEVAHGAKCIL